MKIALDRVEGSAFERFVNHFYPSLAGASFVPLGGVKDGGADAFEGDPVYERGGSPGTFYQASVQEDFRGKIRHTVKRLREFGREPKLLSYITSRTIRHIDTEEDRLGEDLGVTIRIRDGSYIASQINTDMNTRAAFDQHLRYLTDFLKGVGSSTIVSPTANVKSPAVYVFLRQELDRRSGDPSLVNSVIDSLVLWALEGTDPDLERFMTAEEVEQKILAEVPVASLVEGRVQGRLESLASKNRSQGRQVKWYKKEKKFCLPYETRQVLSSDNVEDETLKLEVLNSLYNRASRSYQEMPEGKLRKIAQVVLRSFQFAFESEGLEFSRFVTQESHGEYPTMVDSVRQALAEAGISGDGSIEFGSACLTIIRGVFYDSSPQERTYLGKLARTYALLFTLRTDPRLVQYFQDMAADFNLFVGSDLLVRALSERYLPEKDQITKNLLLFAAKAGTRLILTQPVLEEVLGNLRASDYEFRNHIQQVEHRITLDIAANVPKIMVRSYLYARLDPLLKHPPASWRDFVEQFCDYGTLHRVEAEAQLQHYLLHAFNLKFQSTGDLKALVDSEQVEQITDSLVGLKSDLRLAQNDALLACAVYGQRKARGESSNILEFGFETWWLTTETAMLRHTHDLERLNGGSRYMMRPDFLLNFLTFAPSVDQARRTFSNVFPSLLGIHLSRRLDEATFHKLMDDVQKAELMDEARRSAAMASLADRLKSDLSKRYAVELKEQVNRVPSQRKPTK
ncbi:hypothetical protein [Micromonospora maris]|uniref:hypothetical protein n=1 Tax=Micromonospora maris TaxID=1003110 RepID=UPI0011D2B649|nr:hypothetical protein [Micromonospora maris]